MMQKKTVQGARLFIAEWCEIKGISMREVERRCVRRHGGPTIGTISRYNDGTQRWTRDNVAAIAEVLGIPPIWLMSAESVEHHRLLGAWTRLQPDERESVLLMIENLARRGGADPPLTA